MMGRRKSLLAVAVGLGFVVSTWALASAQDQKGNAQGQPSGNSQGSQGHANSKGEGSADSGEQIDKALQSYQSYRERAGKSAEQARKDVEQKIKDLSELIEMRFQMSLTMAELRSEGTGGPRMSNSGMMSMPPGYAGYYSSSNTSGGQPQSEEERQLQRREALNRELLAVQSQIRNEIDQARGQADQMATQLRSLREQVRAERERVSREKAEKEKAEKADREKADKDKSAKEHSQTK